MSGIVGTDRCLHDEHPAMAEMRNPTVSGVQATREEHVQDNHPTRQSVAFDAPKHHHPHLRSTGRRIKHFLLPDGKKVHVAQSPEEANTLRRRLSAPGGDVDASNQSEKSTPESSGDKHWDIVVHGDEQHVHLLRQTHEWHESARDQLRVKYGAQFDEFERVVRELDALSYELNAISDCVQLDANFERYGYSAHLRTRDSPSGSTSDLLSHSDSRSVRDWDAAKKQGQPMRFWQKPVVRQYFHKGLLWRSQEQQETKSYELFLDLFYVGIIAISGDNSAEEATGQAVLRFAYTFILAWKFWSDIGLTISWFDADDIVQRLAALFCMICLLGLTTNIAGAWDITYTPLIAFYIAQRWFMALYLLWNAWLIPMVRGAMVGNALVVFLPGLLWIGSTFIEDPWARQAIIWPTIFLDLFAYSILVAVERGPNWTGPLQPWLKRVFEFVPGANIEHKIERTNAFVALIFGYSVVNILYQSSVPFGINAFFGKAALSLIQAFSFNWLYFEVDTFNLHVHAIRRHIATAMIWLSIHLPFIMSYVLASAAQAKIVLAHDTSNTDPEKLLEPYAGRSEEEASSGLRWYYCAGIAIALACTGVINLCHTFREIPNQRIPRHIRLALRFAVSIAILLLPLAHEYLDSLQLIATTTCLVVLVLLVEIVGSLCPDDTFWGFRTENCRARTAKYEAKCRATRKELQNGSKDGAVVDVEELARKHGHHEEVNEGILV